MLSSYHNSCLVYLLCFAVQVQEHQDPLRGDCDGVQGPCPFSEIGCPVTKVSILSNP